MVQLTIKFYIQNVFYLKTKQLHHIQLTLALL